MSDIRRPDFILEEIHDIDNVIKSAKIAYKKFPEDNIIEFMLKQDLHRKTLLIKEYRQMNKEFDSLNDLMDFVNDRAYIPGYRDAFAVEYGDDKFSIDYASWNRNNWKFLEKLEEIKKSNPSVKFILKLK